MSSPRDTLALKIDAARKRRAAALAQIAREDALIEDLQAKQRANYTRALRRNAHRPVRLSRIEREIDALFSQEVSF